jgi:hypothetical protein
MKSTKDNTMVQSAVWLPRDLHQRLKRTGGKRGMGEEIRRRLEESFEAEKPAANPKTQELLDAIAFVVGKTDFYYGNWSEDAFAFEVLRACVDLLLTAYQPKGEAAPRAIPKPDTVAALFFGDNESPKDIGRYIIGELMHARSERAREKR